MTPNSPAVYVDWLTPCTPSRAWRWNKSCHLLSYDLDKLHAFARRFGLRRSWFQDGRLPHYDLNAAMRTKAIRAGAVPIPSRAEWRALRLHWRAQTAPLNEIERLLCHMHPGRRLELGDKLGLAGDCRPLRLIARAIHHERIADLRTRVFESESAKSVSRKGA